MEINGKERHFEYLIKAYDDICALCPDEDMSRIGEKFSNPSESVDMAISCAVILNKCYEDHQHHISPDYKPDYLTREDFDFEPVSIMHEVTGEIMKAFREGNRQTVKTEPVNKKGKNA